MDPVQDKNNQPLPVTPVSQDPLEELTNLADDAYQVAMEEVAKADQMEADFAEYKKKFGESMGVTPKETPVAEVTPTVASQETAPVVSETPAEPVMSVQLDTPQATPAMDITPESAPTTESVSAAPSGLADFSPAPDMTASQDAQPSEQVVGEVPTPPSAA